MAVEVLGKGWLEKMSLDGSKISVKEIVREIVTRWQ